MTEIVDGLDHLALRQERVDFLDPAQEGECERERELGDCRYNWVRMML